MPVFLIIINSTDFHFFLVIHLAKIELNLAKKTKFTFIKIMIMKNSIIMAKFFYIISKVLFMSLIITTEVKE